MSTETLTSSPLDAFESRTSFSLSDPASVWVVRSGVLEVFAVRRVNGNGTGALRPLFDVPAGQAAFGLPDAERLGISLVARRSQNSQIATGPAAAAFTVDPAGNGADRHGPLLAEWTAALSRAASGALMPKDVQWLETGTQLKTEDEPRLLSSKEPLMWVRQTAGRSRFLGRPDLVIAGGAAPYPVSRAAWIEPEPNSELVVDAAESLGDEALALGVAAFHADALTCIAAKIDEADQRERQRLRARAEADTRAVESALQDLASPLARNRSQLPTGMPDVIDTPLLRACQKIGNMLGVTMRPHPDMVRGRPVRGPVTAIALASGVRYRRVALRDHWLKRSSEPLLAYRDADEKPVALLPHRTRPGYMLYDPESESLSPLDATVAATLKPFATMFYRPFPQRALTVRDVLRFGVADSKRELIMIVAASAATGLLALLLPYVTSLVFDSIVPNAQRRELLTVATLLVVAALVSGLFNLARGFAVLRLQGKLSLALQAALWDRLLSLPLPFFRDYSAGDLAQRSTAFAQMRSAVSGPTLSAVLSGMFSLFSFGLLFYYSSRLALLALVMTLVALIVTVAAGMFQLKLQRQISMATGLIAGIVVEFITGIAKFRIAGAERRAFVLWVKEFAAQKRLDYDARRITTYLAVFNSVYVVLCTGLFFFLNSGVAAWRGDALSMGDFLAFMAAFAQFMGSALAMGAALVGLAGVVPLYERAAPILRALPEVLTAQSAASELSGAVEAHHLVFRYNADAPLVVRDVSFRILPGEYVAFIGPSGCGKSTLFRLLLGFETANSGSIYYDGADLAGLDTQSVRRQIGVVLQSGTLLAGSIMSNICGATVRPAEEVWEAARLAGLDDDIRSMPMGMHTVLQAGGRGLSGGQRQRVLIARAIVGKPRLLLFDEATSALDNRTQAVVSESLKALKATRIVIAHRLSTILEADRIYVMDQGKIVQSGTYRELMNEPGLFRELAERQLT